MKRVALLTSLSLLVLWTGAAAPSAARSMARSPSPQASPAATPTYAPDDLGGAIPRRVGSLDLYVRAVSAEYAGLGSDPDDRSYWLDFLTARAKAPADMLVAYGIDLGTSEPALEIWAFRVIGLTAEELIEPTLITSGIDLSDIPPGGHADWRDVDGRLVLVLTADGRDDWRAFYALGEVLFVAHGDDRAAVDDVVSALATEALAPSSAPWPTTQPGTSPEATPAFAPDDLADLLPLELGGVGLTIEARTGAEAMADSSDASTAVVRDALLPLGAEPGEMSDAIAFTTDASAPEQYHWSAWRIPGVAADVLFDALVQAELQASGQTLPSGFTWPRRVIDGRPVITFDAPDAVSWQAFYLKGEVLFILQGEGGVTLAEALSVLP